VNGRAAVQAVVERVGRRAAHPTKAKPLIETKQYRAAGTVLRWM
jgi:hypothetical protein